MQWSIFFPVSALILSAAIFSQGDIDFEQLWKEVTELDRKGLYVSAKGKVEEIKALAEKEDDSLQLVKAELYLAKYAGLLNEHDIEKSIVDLEISLKNTEDKVLSAIIHSYLADLHENIHRKNIPNFDRQEQKKKMWMHLMSSVEHLEACYRPVEDYKTLLNVAEKRKNSQEFLSELLYDKARKRLGDEFNAHIRKYPNFFSLPPEEFVKHEVKEDELGLFQLMQDYEQLLLDKKANVALADHYFDRLSHFSTSDIPSEKLKAFVDNTNNQQVLVRAFCQFGEFYDTYGLCKQFYQDQSLPIYERQLVLKTLQDIESPRVNIEMEKVYHSNAPILVAIQQKMVDEVKLDIHKLDPVSFRKMNQSRKSDQEILFRKGTEVFSKIIETTNSRFYYALPDLGYGQYVVKLQGAAEDSLVLNPFMKIEYLTFQVSDLSVVQRDQKEIYVTHRQDGRPLKDVDINVYEYIRGRTVDFESVYTGKTNPEGKFQYHAEQNSYKSKGIWLQRGEDQLIVSNINFYNYRGNNAGFEHAQLFTDRMLYRPGETVQFSGFLTKGDYRDAIHYLHLSPPSVDAQLINAQRQVISKTTLTPDDFGVFTGRFQLPDELLPGVFYISVNNHHGAQIQVEEYKAPKFEVNLTQSNIEDDSVLVKGVAEALAGYPIAGAVVDFEVSLKRRWQWYAYGRNHSGNNQERMIHSGQLTTKSDGSFHIKWKKASLNEDYFMQYHITAIVRDQNGEVVERSIYIPLNMNGLSINWGKLKNTADLSELASAKISFQNLEGKTVRPEGANWKLYSYPMIKSDKITPYFGNIHSEHIQGLPKDIERSIRYYREKEEQQEPVLVAEGALRKDGILPLIRHIDKAGNYKIKVFAQDQEFQHTLKVQSVANAESPDPEPLVHHFDQVKASSSQIVRLSMNARDGKQVNVSIIISQNGRVLRKDWLNISELQYEDILIEEKYRGNLAVDLFYIHQGRYYHKSQIIEVPFDNKKLNVEFLQWPKNADTDSKEKIVLQVKDHFGRPVKAQFAVSIFDKRLDEIKKHHWSADYYPSYNSNANLRRYQFREISTSISNDSYPWHMQNFNTTHFENIFDLGYSFAMDVQFMHAKRAAKLDTVRRISPETYEETLEVMADGEPVNARAASPANEYDGAPREGDSSNPPSAQLRSDLSALMYFNGQIRTDAEGRAEIEFETNDAISNWAVLLHGHTQDLSYYVSKEEFKTYQPILVEPNLPRFVHEGDVMELSSKVVNRTDKPIRISNKVAYFSNDTSELKELQIMEGETLTIEANSSAHFKAKFNVPSGQDQITLRFTAQGQDYADAVEETLPVRSNTVDMIKSIPIRTFQGNTTWDKKALNDILSNSDHVIKQVALEYTGHEYIPILIALTGTFEQEERFATEIFSKWQAFTVVDRLLKKAPELKNVVEEMKAQNVKINPMADLSEYRIIDIDQSKWAKAGEKTTDELYRQLELLLDDRLRKSEQERLWRKLGYLQVNNGGIKWCSSARYSSFSTSLDIAENYLRMKQLGLIDKVNNNFTERLMSYLSAYFEEIIKDEDRDIMSYDRHWISYSVAWKNWENENLWNPTPFIDKIKSNFMDYPVGLQARLGIFLKANNDPTSDTLLQSLVERSFYDPAIGRFWNNIGGWRWGEWKINAQSWLLEFFEKMDQEEKWLIEMKQWLVSHKQGNAWRNARQTFNAVLSFYLTSTINAGLPNVQILESGEKLNADLPYFFKEWKNTNSLEHVSIENSGVYGYGAFLVRFSTKTENAKAGSQQLPLSVKVEYRRVTEGTLEKVRPDDICVGDKIKVELEIDADRPMDYLVIKHNRASGFEPIVKLSGYSRQPNPHYSANYASHQAIFIEHVSRGTHYYDYEFFVEQEGVLRSGISEVQSMYAPEFVNNSENILFTIKQRND